MKKLTVAGLIVNHDGMALGTVVIDRDTGLIDSIEQFDPNADIADPNLRIFPGFLDIHAHSREDLRATQCYKETCVTAAQAAINGGVVLIFSMPNLPVPPTNKAFYNELLRIYQRAPIPVIPYAAIAPGSRPFDLEDGREVAYKMFLAESVNDLKFTSEEETIETIQYYGGKHATAHCDDNRILAKWAGAPTHEQRRPAESEIKAIRFIVAQARAFKFFLKVAHCSTREGLAIINNARMKYRQEIMVEATPHHIMWDYTYLDHNNRKWLQMNPPLRSPSDRKAIEDGLHSGEIDVLVDDHAPHSPEEKLSPQGMSGLTGLDTFGLVTTHLMKNRGFRPEDIARVASWNPGRWANRFLPKDKENGLGYGYIGQGFIGSLTLIDMNRPTTVTRKMLRTNCGHSPFDEVVCPPNGFTFPGRVAYTIVRGEILKKDVS